MDLQVICDGIILVGSAYFMIGKIIDSFAKPTSKIKQKKKEKQKEEIREIFYDILPKYLSQHELETRDKYLSDKERYIQEIKQAVLMDTKDSLQEIKEINMQQNKEISHINDMLDKINNSSKDILRQKIMAIYHANKMSKTLTIYDKEALDELYKDYKAQNGNSYIDKYYGRMKNWTIIDECDLIK